MDNEKIGALIRRLRREQGLTQRGLAEQLGLSDKAVSKWERGLGCPEVSFLPRLSGIFGVDLERMLRGDLTPNELVGGNMKKLSYYVCPTCGPRWSLKRPGRRRSCQCSWWRPTGSLPAATPCERTIISPL